MNKWLKPIVLLADSQLLFRQKEEPARLESWCGWVEVEKPKAAYLGASNGDDPRFYSLFEAAMERAGIVDLRMIRSEYSEEDAAFLSQADIILLAGGDVEKGWNVFRENGVREEIFKRYFDGGLLIGVSAGAVQLGLCGWNQGPDDECELFDTFKLVPFIVDAHDEKQGWDSLKRAVEIAGGKRNGLGIRTGGGFIYYRAGVIEPLLYPLTEFSCVNGIISHSLLLPPDETAPIDASETLN
jgi:peptidase E